MWDVTVQFISLTKLVCTNQYVRLLVLGPLPKQWQTQQYELPNGLGSLYYNMFSPMWILINNLTQKVHLNYISFLKLSLYVCFLQQRTVVTSNCCQNLVWNADFALFNKTPLENRLVIDNRLWKCNDNRLLYFERVHALRITCPTRGKNYRASDRRLTL